MKTTIAAVAARVQAEAHRSWRWAQPRLDRIARHFGLRGWRAGAWLVGGTLALLLLIVTVPKSGTGPNGARLEPSGRRPEVIGFFENGWSSIFQDSFPSLFRNHRVLDTVLAFWYSVDDQGGLRATQPRPDVVAWVKAHHLRMGVLINNVGADHAGMLWTEAVRRKAIRAVVARAEADGYQEIHIDFELLPPDARDSLTAFVGELRTALPRTIVLSVSVFPTRGVPYEISGAYDYAALARAADYLVLMAYDKNSSGGPAGPVSPLPWVRDNIQALLAAGVPPTRLVVAAGVYGYDWAVGSTQAEDLPLNDILKRAAKFGVKTQWDAASAEPFLRYTDAQGAAHVIWYQDARTVKQRMELVRNFGLRGIAIWRLGYDTPKVWEVIEALKTRG